MSSDDFISHTSARRVDLLESVIGRTAPYSLAASLRADDRACTPEYRKWARRARRRMAKR